MSLQSSSRPMQGVIIIVKIHRIFPSQKQWWHKHPLFPIVIVTLKNLQGDENMRRPPNFVILLKNKYLRPRQCPRPKWLWPMPKSLLYRFQYWKKSWGNHQKVQRKKMFSHKSMTKLEALTVVSSTDCNPLTAWFPTKSTTTKRHAHDQ